MSEFAWRAATASGKVEEGRVTAISAAQAIKMLRSQGYTPLQVTDATGKPAQDSGAKATNKAVSAAKARGKTKGPPNRDDVLALSSELSIMLRAGLPLDNALRVLIDMSYKPSVNGMLSEVLETVKGGTPLSRALTKNQTLFGDFYINMIRSGEASGQMSSVLERLVAHLQRQRELRDSVVSAMIYPCILLFAALLSLFLMLGFVVPQFQDLFVQMGDALPLPTRIVMTLGDAFRHQWMWIVGGLLLVVWLVRRWLASPSGKMWWQAAVLRVPLLGPLTLKYQLTLFSRSLGTLLASGVPLLTSVQIASETVSNMLLRRPLEKIGPIVKDGGRVMQAFTSTGIFEPLAINLVRVGEETGRIGPMMLELANILNRDVENGIKRLLTVLEPLLILLLGVLIAFIIVSILLGILSVNNLAT